MSDIQIVHPGQEPKPGPADYFTGSVSVASPFKGTGEARLGGATVPVGGEAPPLRQCLVLHKPVHGLLRRWH